MCLISTLITQRLIVSLYDKLSPATQSLTRGKHLLGFSGGVDSVALFFILLRLNVAFDMAIVHYHTRKEADDEVAYAKDLAQKYNKRCFIAHAPHFHSHFEANARSFRFGFFGEIIATHHYQSLILAHQLNDRLEWFMMQLVRGVGLSNLLGFEDSRSYPIIRPLESIPKNEIYQFCKDEGLAYFEDSSNNDMRFKRNYFRHTFCNELVNSFSEGIARSLMYLQKDKQTLLAALTPQVLYLESLSQALPLESKQHCTIFAYNIIETHLLLLACDKIAKRCGYVLSAKQRNEILKSNFRCKIHHLIIVKNDFALFIALDILNIYHLATQNPMTKRFKTLCAKYHIPPKLRRLLWGEFCMSKNFHENNDMKIKQEIQEDYKAFDLKIRHFFSF